MEHQQKLAVTAGWMSGYLSQIDPKSFPSLDEILGEDEKAAAPASGPMDADEARANMRAWITVMNAGKKPPDHIK